MCWLKDTIWKSEVRSPKCEGKSEVRSPKFLLPTSDFEPRTSDFRCSSGARKGAPAIDAHCCSGDPTRSVGCQKINQVGDLFRLTDSPKRMRRLAVLEERCIGLFIH